ncbi:hypothetical protein R9C00_27505 [Flammeovirgaceae bacterium SG7u.111]|nr:hypothetical protein [Flammeovirgaceae bacterium SG7u.132]WPO35447.1 hypothetical protein R9C00_27505 [Flammeovirgaceae bacterium SG7u.111]
MRRLLILFVSVILVYGCIPIEDKINPKVQGLDIAGTYFYQDTIKFSVIFLDNNGLDSGSLLINKFPIETATEAAWSHIDTFEISGRRVEPSFEIVVPEYKELGTYLITVYGFDEGGNPDTVKRFFDLKGDETAPEINELKIGLEQDSEGNYKACRSTVIDVDGFASDNLNVNKVGFSWGGSKANLAFYSGDSIGLASVFDNKLIVPKNLPSDTLINLNIIAVDSFDNVGVKTIPIKIDCDDIAPSFSLVKSQPRVNINNRTFVTEGNQFTIEEIYVSDNRFTKSVSVYFNKLGEELSLYDEAELNTAETTELSQLLDLEFEIPASANIGDIYEVSLLASDSSGNNSELFVVQTIVIEDKAPLITITDTYINDVDTGFLLSGYTSIKAGEYVTFKGKVEEEFKLDLLQIYWFNERETPQVYLERNIFFSLPLNLASYHDQSSFAIPQSAVAGETYELKIYVVDSKGQEAEVVYKFVVVD